MSTKRAQAQITTGDGWDVRVEAVDTFRLYGDTTRVRWAWSIRSTTDAAEWMPERRWTGNDLTSAIDPDPIAALVSLASFLSAYAEHADYWSCDHSTEPCPSGDCMSDLFPGLDPEIAESIAQAIMLEFPADPTCDYCGRRQDDTLDMVWDGDTGCHVECERGCEECGADKGQPCSPFCTARDSAEVTARIVITNTARATIRETWTFTVPAGVTIPDGAGVEEMFHWLQHDPRVEQDCADEVIGDEDDRADFRVVEMGAVQA